MQLAIFRTRDEMNAVWRLSPYRGGPGNFFQFCPVKRTFRKDFQQKFSDTYLILLIYMFCASVNRKNNIFSCANCVAGSLWVGASDIGQRPGQFYWTDGLRVPDNFWGRNPDDFGSGKKTCACLSNNSANLNDQSCDIPWPFVCQVDQQHRHCV